MAGHLSGAPRFFELVVRSGKVASAGCPSFGGRGMARDLQEIVATFADRLAEAPDGFESRLQFRRWPEVRVRWQALHATAGVADLTYPAQHLAQTLLLLSGKDAPADAAAVGAAEGLMSGRGEPNDLPDTFSQIRAAPRPLLVTFGSVGSVDIDVSVDLIQWGLAAAYFQRLGVLAETEGGPPGP